MESVEVPFILEVAVPNLNARADVLKRSLSAKYSDAIGTDFNDFELFFFVLLT